MANTALWVCIGTLVLATVVFLLGILGLTNNWFDLESAGIITTFSFGAVVVFTAAVSCLLPFYEGR